MSMSESCSTSMPDTARLNNGKVTMRKVFVIGDSISIHYGPYLEAYLKGFMLYGRKEGQNDEALLNLDQPMGANGGDSSMVLEYLQHKILTNDSLQDVDVLLINCGLHDIKKDLVTGNIQIPLQEYKNNLRSVIGLMRNKRPIVEMVWIRSTPVDEKIHNAKHKQFHRYEKDLQAYNQAADEIMALYNISTIDLHRFTNNLRQYGAIFCDHVHFHTSVREKQAAFIAGWLISNRTSQAETTRES